ncbi:glutamine--fructose-6-phosphate transaminase (isomerizing) [Aestuariispira insulae]|uniref:Glutamine--fructose-6-phosphate aminotransferase [isomerizing] n=1 Tax=Aestuariispira insulae TaxID=1461337 RepID=A0A3D9H2U2_9PROT|nr:glutamine--fructose-6-phosphate transaminase (isomerizing) [Aestuariispira insulae]RED43792.1 glutamine--fructose-6-phosphate transaminase [Aestuariispira insulae]
MCGIVGVINGATVAQQLVSGLRNLEYRGYDSAGVATHTGSGIWRHRSTGKINELEQSLASVLEDGPAGIGHTRWATHGIPSQANAHPHMSEGIAVVHNGIIENFAKLRDELQSNGACFTSETDSEVIPHLIAHYQNQGMDAIHATRAAMSRLDGQFALAVLFEDMPGTVLAARQESPLALGYNEKEALIASDMLAFAGHTDAEMHLGNGDLAIVRRDKVIILDPDFKTVDARWTENKTTGQVQCLNGHDHFMHKEIHEQPAILSDLNGHDDQWCQMMAQMPDAMVKAQHISVVACGTSYYAGMTARSWFEKYAGISISVEFASEFRYRAGAIRPGRAGLFISQSGETADTLAGLRHFNNHGCPTIAVVNVPTSAMAREAEMAVPTRAGSEIGVASTKAFTAQLATLLRLAIELGSRNGTLDTKNYRRIRREMEEMPNLVREVLSNEHIIKSVTSLLGDCTSTLFVGRGDCYPLALEGALKLKEISYIHAEGFAAGELKHGPIALIDENMPVFVLAPDTPLLVKTSSNAREIAARNGKLFVLTDDDEAAGFKGEKGVEFIKMPPCTEDQIPFVYVTALQLISYHAALDRSADVDRPRNLAKSVTVE